MLLRIAKFHLKRKREKKKMCIRRHRHTFPLRKWNWTVLLQELKGGGFASLSTTDCLQIFISTVLEYVCYYIKLISQLRLTHAYLQLDGNPETDNSWIQNLVSMMHALFTKWSYVLQLYRRIISNAFNYTKYISIWYLSIIAEARAGYQLQTYPSFYFCR